jgi:hypothetical protein
MFMPASLAVLTSDLPRLRDFVFKRGALGPSTHLQRRFAGHGHDLTITRESLNYPGRM